MDSGSPESSRGEPPANDTSLDQLVRGSLGKRRRGTSGTNVSSCSFVVTLHGRVGSAGEREQLENIVRTVPGVDDVANRLKMAQEVALPAVSRGVFRGISVVRALFPSEWR